MTKLSELSEFKGDQRNLSYDWEPIPSSSPLGRSYEEMLIATITEKAPLATDLKCQVSQCDNQAWMVVRENPIRLRSHDGGVVDISNLDPKLSEQIYQSRKRVASICKSHLMERYAESLKKT
jgi:hypothetical protein